MAQNEKELHRGLESRHIEMIALGGTIGVGLFLGSASTIKWTGPSVMLAYAIAGFFLFFIMRSMGEMLYIEPTTGSFATFAHKYINPLSGYMTAWSYWFLWVTVGMSEVVAVGLYMKFWYPGLPQWIPGIVAILIIGAANLVSVKYYGEFEFWFALVKVVTIVAMILLGLAVIFFGFSNQGHPLGLGNLTAHGGFFPGGLKGFLFALALVVAAYQGVEMIGITAGEARNPQQTLKRAIQNITWRILIFYIGAIFVIITIYPWNQLGTFGSPFVATFAKFGIAAAAGIINFVVITAALSGCNSGIYSCGRMLYTLALNGQAPKFLAKISPKGVPANAIYLTLAILFLGVIMNMFGSEKLFLYIYSASVLPGMVPWFVLLIAQLKFREVKSKEMAKHPFKMPLSPLSNYASIAFLIAVLIGMWFNPDTRLSLIVGIIFLAIVIASFYVFKMAEKEPLEAASVLHKDDLVGER